MSHPHTSLQAQFLAMRSITRIILLAMKTAISIPYPIFEAAEQLVQQLGISRSHLSSRPGREQETDGNRVEGYHHER